MLSGRTVVITGAARGVGLAIARACAKHGARLILSDKLSELGQAEADNLIAEGADARFVPIDLSDPVSIEAFADNIKAHEGLIDGLVNNAAIATKVGGAAFENIHLDLWDNVMRVNVRGTWLVTRALSPLFGADARIVNMASDTALWGPPKLLAYVASKGAIIAMTRSMARELGPRGVGIVAVAPGIMRNEATDYVPPERHEQNEKGRAIEGPQHPEDIVDVVAFCLTPAALPMTGQVVPVNAGFVFT